MMQSERAESKRSQRVNEIEKEMNRSQRELVRENGEEPEGYRNITESMRKIWKTVNDV